MDSVKQIANTPTATGEAKRSGGRLADRDGFVIPATIFALLMMSTLAVAAILTSGDAQRSSRAIRESNLALYSAEAGLNEVWATWDDTLITGLNPGDSLDLGWRSMPAGGGSYRVVIRRMDNGGQKIFALTSEGRGAGPLGGQRMISLTVSSVTDNEICCSAAVKGRAEFEIEHANVSGFDSIPGGWDDGATCGNGQDDLPGMHWDGDVDLDMASVDGDPPLVQDTTINPTNLFEWGYFNYDSLVARADITLNGDVGTIAPTTVGGACDTSNKYNWGAPDDPNHPCFDYFPIIHANQLEIENGSIGQGILLVDSELQIEAAGSFTFYGLMIIKDETEFEETVTIYGGLIINGEFEIDTGPRVQYSQCAVNRTLVANDLTHTRVLASRSWGEVLR